MITFEGNIFQKNRKHNEVSLNYSFCNPLYCTDFGPDSVGLNTGFYNLTFSNNSGTILLDKKKTFCDKEQVLGIYFYNTLSRSTGKLFWMENNTYREALFVSYDSGMQAEVENILATIRKK